MASAEPLLDEGEVVQAPHQEEDVGEAGRLLGDLPGPEGAPAAGVSPVVAVMALANATIGAGVLSLPMGFSETGLVGGLLLALVVGTSQTGTLCLITRAAVRAGAGSYQELVGTSLGPRWSLLMTLVIIVYQFGSCVAYLIIVGDTWASLMDDALAGGAGGQPWWAGRRAGAVALGCGIILPLSTPRTLGAMARAGSLAIVGLAFTAGVVVLRGVQALSRPGGAQGLALARADPGALAALPLFVFAFQCHVQVAPVYAELRGARGAGGGAPKGGGAQAAMDRVCAAAMALCFTGYALVGSFGYACFPRGVRSDVLDSFPDDDPLVAWARATIGTVAAVAYPVNLFPGRSAVVDLLPDPEAGWVHPTVTLAWFAGTLGLALAVSSLGAVFEVIGGTAGVLLIFFIPGCLAVGRRPGGGGEEGDGEAVPAEGAAEGEAEGGAGAAAAARGPGAMGWCLGAVLWGASALVFAATMLATFGGAA